MKQLLLFGLADIDHDGQGLRLEAIGTVSTTLDT